MPNLDPDRDPPLSAPLVAILAFSAVCLLFFRLGDYRTLGRHEVYAAVAAREMMTSGDWIVPRFGGLPRLEKPPLGYWLVATSATLLGGLDEFTARVPAALAALALSAVVGVWAGRWHGRTAGLGAALAATTSVFVMTYGRRAEVDMTLCLLTTSALFLIADQPADERGRPAFARWVGIYAILAVSWLAKFHYGPAMVLIPAAVYYGVQGRYRAWLQILNPIGLVLMGAAVTVWPWLLLSRVPNALQVWANETIGRAVGTQGHEPFWFYVPHLLVLVLPWTPLAAVAVPASWRRAWSCGFAVLRDLLRRRVSLRNGITDWNDAAQSDDARERFLWVTFAVQFGIVTASADKHPHYLAAALPAMWILAGQGFAAAVAAFRTGQLEVTRRAALSATGVSLAAATAVALVLEKVWPELSSASLLIAACIGIGGTVVVWLFYSGDHIPACFVTIGAFLGAHLVVTGELMPAADRRHADVAAFARSLRDESGPDETVWAYGVGMHAVIYYAENPVRRIEARDELVERLETTRGLRVVTLESRLDELVEVAAVRVLRRPEFRGTKKVSRTDALVLADLACAEDIAAGPDERSALRDDEERH